MLYKNSVWNLNGGLAMKSEEASRASEEKRISAELAAMIRLHKISTLSVTQGDIGIILCEIVDAAIDVAGADFGTIQLIDPASPALRIVAQRGFPQWWVDFWNKAPDAQGSCGMSLQRRERVIVENVEQSAIFAGAALEMQIKAGVRAVQSTPLVSRSGKLLGTFSTHYRKTHRPDEYKLRVLDLLARQAADIIEHVQAVAMLRESEERFRNVADGVPLMMWVSDPAGNARFINRAYMDFFGITLEDLKSRGWQSLIHPDDVAAYVAEVTACLRDRRFLHAEMRVKRRDGEWRWLESFGQPQFSSTGEFLGMAGSSPDITERKRTEETLRSVSAELRQTLHVAATGLNHCSRDLRYLSANPTYAQYLGLPLEQIIGKSIVEVIGTAALETIRPRIERVLRGEAVEYEDEVPYPSGKRWMRGAYTPDRDTSGNVVGWVASIIDITEHIKAEEALQEREQRLRLALEASGGGSWMRDVCTGRVDWDDRFRELYGFTAEEPASFEAWLGRVHEEDRRQALDLWDQILHTKTRDTFDTTFRIVRPDGTVLWIQSLGQVHRDGGGHVMRLNGLELDVTERRRAEEALQARRDEERDRTLQLLLETAPLGILSTDAGGVIVTANRALEKMFGWGLGELIGRSVDELVTPALRDRHAMHRDGYFGAPQPRLMGGGLQLEGWRKDGSTFPIEISLNHVGTADGGHAIAFVNDISARRRDEEALQRGHAELERRTLQLSRLASQLTLAEQHAREQLARTLHDGLQQLLFIAGITLDRALKGASKSDQAGLLQNARANINEAMEAARTLSVDLFPPVLHTGGLPAALDWLARRTREQYGLLVEVTTDPQANPEGIDVRILLFEAVRELLFNAIKHAHARRVDINLGLQPGDIIHLDVSDDGVGFDPAVTLHHKDQHQIGLGLFSIQERFALLGGHFYIQSAPGKGARFSLMLPRTGLPHPQTDGREASHATDWRESPVYDSANDTSKTLQILIADDHAVARAGLRELFSQRSPLRVVGEAANGVEAISLAMALQPDVIVMDVSMPQMNGIEATRQIHGTLPHIRIVGLSTYDDEDTERAMLEAGAEAYFTKNEGADRLLDHLLSLSVQAKGAGKN
jgi:PAS domain S-box-containing protein